MTTIPASKITIRWFDGFKRTFEIAEFETGSDWLWIKFKNGKERWIPTRQVRWCEPE